MTSTSGMSKAVRSKSASIALGRPFGATLLCGGLMLLGLSAVMASWADLSAVTEERDAKADLLQRGITASRRAQAAPTAPAADPFVPGDTATLAAAAIDADLRVRAASAGLFLLSSRAEAKPDEPEASGVSKASAVGMRIEDQAVLEGQNEALQALLMALETGTPTVLVDDIAIEPASVDATSPGGSEAPRLHVSLTVSAYWRSRRTTQ